ncbi:MAG: hypothetical protein JWM91_421 [Rhodospirillales bacterium]|nr:hypothetical protein [Rhodospirillales bacterium]
MSTDEFIRIGDAARLLAFHLGQRFASNGHAHLGTARDKLLTAAQNGEFPIVAGTESWSVAASFPLPAECVHGLKADNIDWDESVFDASSDAPVAATAAIQQLHSGPAVLWVPTAGVTGSFKIDSQTVGKWNRR